jgi:thiol-disulfide isomerase/thioredoxin
LGNSSTDDFIDASETLALFKAEVADANHQTKLAYDSLAQFYSKRPSSELYSAIIIYAEKLGLDSNKVADAIWKLRDSIASKKIYFTFKNYRDQKNVSLSDFKGKIVLLTYWFPSCAPCRMEFPHFESVLKRLNNKDVVYLAVNIARQEDSNVLPLTESEDYSFIPLFDDGQGKRNLSPVRVAPSNFLIDPQGRIVFSDFRVDQTNEGTLELMITDLLRLKNLSGKKPIIDSVKKDTIVKNNLSDSVNTL